MKNKAILLSSLLMAGSSAFAATITVPPGNGLQAAIAAAAEGDTILLESGVYTNADAQIEMGVSLTIKAASAAASPVIQDSLYVPQGQSVDKLTVQGIQVDEIGAFQSTLNEVEILETVLVNSASEFRDLRKFTMIGSTTFCSVNKNPYFSISADEAVIAGNNFCVQSGSSFSSTDKGNQSITVIGNTFTSISSSSSLSLHYWAEAIIAGNRFTQQWAMPGETYAAVGESYSFIRNSSNERLLVRNNIFKNDPTRLSGAVELLRFAPLTYVENLYFENNLVDAANAPIWVPDLGESEQAGMMEYASQTPITLQGNIFINYQDNILPLPATELDAGAQYNLCYNNSTNCGTDNGNLETDPMLVNGYKLDSSSPAVDAGPVDPMLSDLDATRNNMGPYGGSWSIDQFDAQREVSTAPYLYPVVDVAKTVANGNVQVKFVSYGRQL